MLEYFLIGQYSFLAKHIQANGTYKVIWQGHTLLVAGTTDMSKQWHQLGVMTTKRERSDDYAFFFRSVKKAVLQCLDIEYLPSCLVADAAGAITKGFMKAFGYNLLREFTRVTCYQHVKRAIIAHSVLITDKEVRIEIKKDISVLQACQSKRLFDKAVELFLHKWETGQSAFINYFKKQWLNPKRNGWYQGIATCIPDHNNNNESDNRYIKEG